MDKIITWALQLIVQLGFGTFNTRHASLELLEYIGTATQLAVGEGEIIFTIKFGVK